MSLADRFQCSGLKVHFGISLNCPDNKQLFRMESAGYPCRPVFENIKLSAQGLFLTLTYLFIKKEAAQFINDGHVHSDINSTAAHITVCYTSSTWCQKYLRSLKNWKRNPLYIGSLWLLIKKDYIWEWKRSQWLQHLWELFLLFYFRLRFKWSCLKLKGV